MESLHPVSFAAVDFEELLELVGFDPVFETDLLLMEGEEPSAVHRQLAEWVEAGWIYQLRLGVYTLAPPFLRVRPHPFVIANHLVRGSYVSLGSALSHYGLTPRHDLSAVTVSVASSRPGRWHTQLGDYEFRHLRGELLTGFRLVRLPERQEACVATPEKALLDLVYLEPGADSPDFLRRLQLQSLQSLNLHELHRQAEITGKTRLRRAADWISSMARAGR